MKNLLYLLVLLLGVTIFSCDDDEATDSSNILFFDAGPNSAPIFQAGTFEAAARFPRSLTSTFTGQSLVEVEFFLVNTPSNTFVRIYDEGTGDTPGDLLYEANVTSTATADSWNTHILDDPVAITGDELWISIQFVHTEARNTIGCDVGPAVTNGDWVSEGTGQNFETFRSFTDNAVSINWNIRGNVE